MSFNNCASCGARAKSKCSKCSSVYYCDRECQLRHWKAGHNSQCKLLKAQRDLDAPATEISANSTPASRDGIQGSAPAKEAATGASVPEVGMLKGAEAKRTPAEPSKSLVLSGAEATRELIAARMKVLNNVKSIEQRPVAIHSHVAGDLVAKTTVVPELVATAKGQEGIGFGKWGRDGYSEDCSGDTVCILRPTDPHRDNTLGGQATYSVRLEANKLLMEQQLAVVTVKTFEAARGALEYFKYTKVHHSQGVNAGEVKKYKAGKTNSRPPCWDDVINVCDLEVLVVYCAKDKDIANAINEEEDPYGVWREELYTATAFAVSGRAFIKVFAVAFTQSGAVDFALVLVQGQLKKVLKLSASLMGHQAGEACPSENFRFVSLASCAFDVPSSILNTVVAFKCPLVAQVSAHVAGGHRRRNRRRARARRGNRRRPEGSVGPAAFLGPRARRASRGQLLSHD